MITVNKVKTLVYVASGFSAGLTDLTLAIRQPDGTLVSPVVTFTEQGAGVYTATYTPTQTGTYQEKITSATNGDNVIHTEDVVAKDASDVDADVATMKTDMDTSFTTTNGKVDAIKTDVDASTTAIQGSIAALQITANQIKAAEGKSGGYVA